MKKLGCLFLLTMMVLLSFPAPVMAGDVVNPYDIITEVNKVRTGNGLPALEVDSVLMGTAQATAETMAALGSCYHIGDVKGRVTAAGYGGTAGAWATENISCGVSKTLQSIVYSDWADDQHMIPMVNANYKHIGAGVAVVDDYIYYVLHAAYPAGGNYVSISPSTGSTPGVTTVSGTASTPGTSATSAAGKVVPVLTVTPQEDGSIIHIVQAGQTLWSIATTYGTHIVDIQNLNNMLPANLSVYIGQKLKIRAAFTPTVSPTITNTPRPPTRTSRPTWTPKPPTSSPTVGPTPTQTSRPLLPALSDEPSSSRQTSGIILIGICVIGLVVVLANSLRPKRK